jgi:hypothetical protein
VSAATDRARARQAAPHLDCTGRGLPFRGFPARPGVGRHDAAARRPRRDVPCTIGCFLTCFSRKQRSQPVVPGLATGGRDGGWGGGADLVFSSGGMIARMFWTVKFGKGWCQGRPPAHDGAAVAKEPVPEQSDPRRRDGYGAPTASIRGSGRHSPVAFCRARLALNCAASWCRRQAGQRGEAA